MSKDDPGEFPPSSPQNSADTIGGDLRHRAAVGATEEDPAWTCGNPVGMSELLSSEDLTEFVSSIDRVHRRVTGSHTTLIHPGIRGVHNTVTIYCHIIQIGLAGHADGSQCTAFRSMKAPDAVTVRDKEGVSSQGHTLRRQERSVWPDAIDPPKSLHLAAWFEARNEALRLRDARSGAQVGDEVDVRKGVMEDRLRGFESDAFHVEVSVAIGYLRWRG